MRLRATLHDDPRCLEEAAALETQIEACVASEAKHPSVQHIQDIFREGQGRVYQWAISRDIPAENNRDERELRPLVIARKISFGSRSEKGLHAREVLMSLLHTMSKRTEDAVGLFARPYTGRLRLIDRRRAN